ncbi:site-specific DNA-methyltransferase (plasmid) [Citricoccus nitrophenolicus]
MSNKLDELLSRVTDPDLRAALQDGIEELHGNRTFGLVFEKHLPESVRLPGTRITRGSCAVRRSEAGNTNLLRVLSTRRGIATCRPEDEPGAETQDIPVEELVSVARFGDPVFPGLQHIGSAVGSERADADSQTGEPAHLVLEGENFHALQALRYTHAGQVDLIYIDPPYNTGSNDWIYNDRYIGDQDAFRHSKWLSFMERRLELARDLLSDTGVIFVAIGDDEHHRLRMLMDQVFGPQNFISDIVWQGGRKNDSRYISNGADYMLVYARSEEALREAGVRWRERKPGVEEALEKAAEIWRDYNHDEAEANTRWKKWLKGQKAAGISTDAVNRYDLLQSGTGRPIHTYGDLTWPGGGGGDFDVIHPVTGKPVKRPVRGWLYKTPERMQEEIEKGRVFFGTEETMIPRGIRYLDEMDSQVAMSVFSHDRKATNGQMREVFGDTRFPNPKDHRVLTRWIQLTAPKDATVLDFFAGSGSTGEAVLRLNAEDGGTRKFILITNNELNAKDDKRLRKAGQEPGHPEYEKMGVFQHVTWPRLQTVLTGVREDGTQYSDGLPGRIEAFRLTYQNPDQVADHLAFKAVSPLLWMMAGTAGTPLTEVPARGWAAAGSHLVITNVARAEEALQEIPETVTTVFTVTDSDSEFATVNHRIPETVRHVRLYSHYLSQFMVNTGD